MTMINPISGDTLERALGDLRTAAPRSVGFGALVEAGLADRYAAIDTALGSVFIAWNGRGVSWVTPAADPARFEERFRTTLRRDIAPAEDLPERLGGAIARRLDGDRRVRIP